MIDELRQEQAAESPPRQKKRHDNGGIRKLCGCARRNWGKCPHSWYFNFKPRFGQPYAFSMDKELGRHLKTKEEAETEAEKIRIAIRENVFVRAVDRVRAEAAAKEVAAKEAAEKPGGVTLDAFAQLYIERVSKVRDRNKSWKNDQYVFSRLGAFQLTDGTRLGDKPMAAITEDDLEAFVGTLRTQGRAASTKNGYVQVIKASFRWAAKKRYVAQTPISGESKIIKRSKHAQRNRRLVGAVVDKNGKVIVKSEEDRLIGAAPSHVQRLIIAAIETCCRRGELLKLLWKDVDLEGGDITVRAENAKTAVERVLPISDRLAAVLEMCKTDPLGRNHKPTAYVFGEMGQPIKNIKKAWETAILRAHGHEPVWQKTGLAAASRAELKAINLHFHDLRHEGASRLLEQGWSLHEVSLMLGHADISQTSTYLNVAIGGLKERMRKTDQEKRSGCNSVVKSEAIEHPLPYNGEQSKADQPLVN